MTELSQVSGQYVGPLFWRWWHEAGARAAIAHVDVHRVKGRRHDVFSWPRHRGFFPSISALHWRSATFFGRRSRGGHSPFERKYNASRPCKLDYHAFRHFGGVQKGGNMHRERRNVPPITAARAVGVLLLAVLVVTSGCSSVKDTFALRKSSETRPLGPGRFDVTESGNNYVENRQDVYNRWEQRAASACGSSSYTVVSRNYDQSQTPLVLVNGVIECSTAPPRAATSPTPAPSATLPAPIAPVAQPAAASREMSVAQAQSKLLALGYQIGAPDGRMGPRTAEALHKFQRDRKIPATGRLDAQTVEELLK